MIISMDPSNFEKNKTIKVTVTDTQFFDKEGMRLDG